MNIKKVALWFSIIIILDFIATSVRFSTSTGHNFLINLLQGGENGAIKYLHPDLKAMVKTNCPDGAATKCAEPAISDEWGELERILPVYAIAQNQDVDGRLYYTFWSNVDNPISVVLLFERNSNLILGWRGIVISGGEDQDYELLTGERKDNELSIVALFFTVI